MTRSSKLLVYGMGVIFALILVQKAFIMYTDLLWFDALGQRQVFTLILGTRVGLGVLLGGLFFAFLYGNLRLARRPLPADLTLIGKRLLPEEERQQIEQYADRALLVFAITGALMGGIVASGHWRDWLQFRHGGSFGEVDALFGRDLGFYIFDLSFIGYLVQALFYAISITLVVTVLIHIYQESIRLVGNTVHAVPRARTHVLVLLGLALLVKAVSYRLAQFNLLYSGRGEEFFGASYADVHGRMPVLWALIVVAALAGIIMFVSTRLRSFNLPIGALVVLLLVSILGGWMYPAMIQQFVVKPDQLGRETPYILNNIKATRKAHQLDQMHVRNHTVREDLSAEALRDNLATIENIRLWDHRPLETTFQQTQALRSYYRFSDVDVDRYEVGGRERQVMLGARTLDHSGIQRPTWVSQHLLYTHGYGLCMAPVNEIVGDGMPNYWIKDFPPTSPVGFEIKRPQLYYYTSLHPRLIEYITSYERQLAPDETPAAPAPGPAGPEATPGAPAPGPSPVPSAAPQQRPAPVDVSYVIVNTKEQEFDYPRGELDETGTEAEAGNATTRYAGKGDVQLSSFFRRFCFFVRFRQLPILLTPSLTPESRILFNRTLPERLMQLAPIMGYDPDPYMVIANGELKWINDAYTATNMYPYAARTPWFGANYVRNSVKVVTDAYDGLPEFYVMPPTPGDKADPILECWRQVFPTLFKDFADLNPVVQAHIRYPQLLFRVQAEMYAKYHMTHPQTFFQKEDMWAIPPEVYAKSRREVESFYVNMKLPGTSDAGTEFLLMQPFTLAGAEERNMVAWMAARCDAPNYGQVMVYRFPKQSLVPGPMQVESLISQDPQISQLITLWSQQQSRVIRGNLLVIPVNDALLYVEPLYLESPTTPLPQLKLVIIVYGNRIVNAPTLDGALEKLFGQGAGRMLRPSVISPAARIEGPTPQPTPAPTPAGGTADVKQLLQQALELDREAQQALAQGDLATYQAKQRQQQELIQRAAQQLP